MSMQRNTQDAAQKTRRTKQAAANHKTKWSSVSICTAHKIPTTTMRPYGLKVMCNTPKMWIQDRPCTIEQRIKEKRRKEKT